MLLGEKWREFGHWKGFVFCNTTKYKGTQKLGSLFHHVNPCLSKLLESSLKVKILCENLASEIPSNYYPKSFFSSLSTVGKEKSGVPLAFESGIQVLGNW